MNTITKKEILEKWRNLSNKEVLILEFKEFDEDYTIVLSKENADITFEHEVLMHHYDSPFPEREYVYFVAFTDDEHVRIPLKYVTNVFTYDREKAYLKMMELKQ